MLYGEFLQRQRRQSYQGHEQISNNGGNNVSINAGAGNDNIQNSGNNVTINAGAGNDYLQNEWNAGTVYVYTSGNDTINYFNEMDNLVIANAKWTSQRTDNTVEGKGTITMNCDTAWGSQVNIVSSIKDIRYHNSISNDKDRKTVKGTAANDDIWNGGDNVSINAGNGFNRISNGEWHGDEEGTSRGHYTTITSGKNADVIWNSADHVLINTGDGDDAVDNIHAKTSVTINAGAGNDTISNNADTVTIEAGDDDIYNYKEWNWNEETQSYEYTSPDNVKILGGAGNDYIYNEGSNVTIDGGAGDDTIIQRRWLQSFVHLQRRQRFDSRLQRDLDAQNFFGHGKFSYD